jgi:hypothetical protein
MVIATDINHPIEINPGRQCMITDGNGQARHIFQCIHGVMTVFGMVTIHLLLRCITRQSIKAMSISSGMKATG